MRHSDVFFIHINGRHQLARKNASVMQQITVNVKLNKKLSRKGIALKKKNADRDEIIKANPY